MWIFARCLRTLFLQSTSGWLLVFYNCRWVYILQVNIAGNFQVERSHHSGKKIVHIFRGFYRFRHFFTKIFSIIFSYTKHMLCSEQTTVSLDWRHLNTILLTNFENLNSISNIFQETLHFLVLTDPRIICIYLRTSDRHFRHQGNVRHSASELLKCVLV